MLPELVVQYYHCVYSTIEQRGRLADAVHTDGGHHQRYAKDVTA